MMSEPFLSYARHLIDEEDVAAVAKTLRSDWLTTGPMTERFEEALANEVGSRYAIVCSSGTAALYLAASGVGLCAGDRVIVPTITFVATASANLLAGFEVVFADVDANTGLMHVEHVAEALHRNGQERVKAICPVHLGGRVADPVGLQCFADENGLIIIEDACHALGTRYSGEAVFQVGGCKHSVAACFSFHPIKTVAMGEGGAVTTNSKELAQRARLLRNHGLSRSAEITVNRELAVAASGELNPWYYEVSEISHNFRASEINCALGLSQLRKLAKSLDARRRLMAHYKARLASLGPSIHLVPYASGTEPGWHLCAITIEFDDIELDRSVLMARLMARGIGTQVHYIPVHLQPYYRRRYGNLDLPGARAYYNRTLSLPLHAAMTEADVDRVVSALQASIN